MTTKFESSRWLFFLGQAPHRSTLRTPLANAGRTSSQRPRLRQINLQKVNAVETHPKPQFTILHAPAILPKVLPRGTPGDCDSFRVLRVFCSRQLSLVRRRFWEACYDLAEP